jgi:hypothetical protein
MKLVSWRIFDIRNNNESIFDVTQLSSLQWDVFFFDNFDQKLMFFFGRAER